MRWFPAGTAVQFRPPFVGRYASTYGVTADAIFHIAHIEKRGRRRVLYLWRIDGEWLPTFASHIRKARKQSHGPKAA